MSGPIRAKDVRAEQVEWLWRDRIPKGMISIVAGRPDQGKGLFAAHVAAEVSQTSKVLYSAAEDSHGLMTRPRLEVAGANLENILLWRFSLPAQSKEVADLLVRHEIALLVIDPFASHIGGGVSRHGDNVRSVLDPLKNLIEQTRTSVLVVEHVNKRVPSGSSPLSAIGGGSSGLPAFARSAFVFGVDPSDEDRRILAPAKFNIGPKPRSLAFEVDVEDLDVVGAVPLLVEDEELEVFDPMRLFEKKKNETVGRPPDKRAAAAEWLTQYLAGNGVSPAGKVQEDSKQYGMAAKTLRRAADDMGVVKNPPGGGRNCTWDLPDDVKSLLGLPVSGQPEVEEDPDKPEIVEVESGSKVLESTDDALAELLGGGDGDGA
jgi:hypothetical protein